MARLSVSQYCALLDAGYTAEELDTYNREHSTPENPNIISTPSPDPAPAPAENPNIISNPSPDPAPAPAENPNNEAGALVNEMRQLIAIMRNANIRDINMPTETPPDAAQVMATILAPQKNN